LLLDGQSADGRPVAVSQIFHPSITLIQQAPDSIGRMSRSRLVGSVACVCALSLAGCGSGSSASTTSPSSVPAAATMNESFAGTVGVGEGLFYSFSMAQYGNVAVTLTGISGTDLPDDLTLTVGIGRPAGTSCTTSTAITAGPGDTPQVTGTYGPGVFCVRISDSGTLTSAVDITAAVAHS